MKKFKLMINFILIEKSLDKRQAFLIIIINNNVLDLLEVVPIIHLNYIDNRLLQTLIYRCKSM